MKKNFLQALINEKVEVSVTDEVVFNAETRKEYDVKVALLGKDNYPTAFMFQKNNPGLAQASPDSLEKLRSLCREIIEEPTSRGFRIKLLL